MKLLITTAAAALFGAGAALAAGAPELSELDTSGTGTVNLEEAQAYDPSITAESFAQFDLNADGELDSDEFSLWAAGMDSSTTGQGDVDFGDEYDSGIDSGVDSGVDSGIDSDAGDYDAGAGADYDSDL